MVKPVSTKVQGEIVAFGYIKAEDSLFTAICVNMGLFGQGKTPEAAFKKCFAAIESYVKYVLKEHPTEWKQYLDRPAPKEMVEEFRAGLEQLQKLMSEPCIVGKTTKKATKKTQPMLFPVRSFAEPISLAQA